MTDDKDRIRANVAKMEAQGATPDEIEHYLRDVEGLSSVDASEGDPETMGDKAMGALAAGYQGLTLGAGDKIIAGIQTALPAKLGGQKGWDFKQNLRDTREVLDNFRDRHPAAAVGVELAGAAPLMLMGGGASQAGRLAKIGRGAVKGFEGGAAAFGLDAIKPDATLEDVMSRSATGAAVGGTLGAALPAGAAAAGMMKKAPPGVTKEILTAAAPRNVMRVVRVLKALNKAAPKAEAAVAKEPGFIGNSVDNLPEAAGARSTGPTSPRHVPTLEETLERMIAPAEKSSGAEGFIGNSMENLRDAAAAVTHEPIAPRANALDRQLEEALASPNIVKAAGRSRTASGALQKGAPSARFEHFAEQMAKRKASQTAEAAEPTLEDLLGLSIEHIKKGGSLKSAGEALRLVRPH